MKMTQQNEVYKCNNCGNIIGVIHSADGILSCCGNDMVQQIENTVDAAKEKHVPVIEKNGKSVTVKVGSIDHPMEENHYIEVIGISTENKLYREYLKPGSKPEATFEVDEEIKCARAYCNLHGLWKSE
jgi:superoxide reductase